MSGFVVNSFQVPNALIDSMMSSMSGNALKCLMYIIRQTRGWHKKTDSISVSSFVAKCGMSKNTALSSIKELVSLGLVKQTKGSASTALNAYSLTKLFDSGEVLNCSSSAKNEPVQILTGANFEPPSAKIEPVASAKIEPTKDILFKDTIQKTNTKNMSCEAIEIKFEKFWKAYPKHRHVGKQKAFAIFKKINPSDDQLKKMVEVVEAYAKTKDWTKDGGIFCPHPSTWLNNARWNDVIITSNAVEEFSLLDAVKKHYEESEVHGECKALLG